MATPPQRPGFPARIDLGSRPTAGVSRPGTPRPAPRSVEGGTAASAGAPAAVRDSIPARARMVQQLMAEGISDPLVLRAMGSVDRHRFVDSALVPQAYEDTALPIGLGQTISKPSVVARMLELLMQGGLKGDNGKLGRVLDIGTGCGYQAVVMGQIATEVYSIERLRDLHEKARANLRPLRIANVHLILGDGMAGFPSGAPYAGIVAAAGGEAVPDAWIDQLAYGGRIVAPVASAPGQQALMVIDKSRSGLRQTILEAVNFVPLKSGVA
ncbi:protein-L-isoaspartate(D-aspartate) O-methyltransferase [Ottowia sp. GY511]|uniref:Protein-L-isoaspartate O-methyltransferase n=1 Tax=Ottowia flava TaxID=2675430 RepID=A0ABW4KX80_9BURK|nr:protein-L-isoaspartate(D-aspartate) O-methyltransferase [Ottowia sp. GY511]TXK33474.1 protein-L-isoaspartate(D-aspartate) O-methyltransferase [Ottowia sp. GY511]